VGGWREIGRSLWISAKWSRTTERSIRTYSPDPGDRERVFGDSPMLTTLGWRRGKNRVSEIGRVSNVEFEEDVVDFEVLTWRMREE
jgi:hypothetical protein